MKTAIRLLLILLLPGSVLAADTAMRAEAPAPVPAPTTGLPLAVPADFRARFVHLGSWIVPDPAAPGHGFHDVYTEPATLTAYRRSGVFPEGATLVKEIRGIKTEARTTGLASWATDTAVWFVMVKDGKGRYRKSPLWGDGWLWALYKADQPAHNVASSYQADCRGCHLPAARTERVFVEGYPTLRQP